MSAEFAETIKFFVLILFLEPRMRKMLNCIKQFTLEKHYKCKVYFQSGYQNSEMFSVPLCVKGSQLQQAAPIQRKFSTLSD